MTHLNEAQIATLLRLAEARPRDHALLSMAAYTALRITDILGLSVYNILDEYGRIRKNLVLLPRRARKPMDIPLPDPLRQSLRRYLDERVVSDRSEPLFINRDHNTRHNLQRGSARLSRSGAHNIFKNYLAQTLGVTREELRGLSTHAFRRSLAWLAYNRHGLRAAQELLGHGHVSATGAYLDKMLASKQALGFREALNFTWKGKTGPSSSQ